MKTRIVTLACVALSVVSLPVQAAKKHKPAPPVAAPEPAPQTPGERLSSFLKWHLDSILAPLGSSGFGKTQELIDLRESFADGLAKAPEAKKPMYHAAMNVCDELAKAYDEREQAVSSLAGSKNVHESATLGATRKVNLHWGWDAWAEEHREQREQKQRNKSAAKTDAFFSAAQKAQWKTRAGQLRQGIEQLYEQERALERQSEAAPAAQAPAPAPAS